MDLIVAKFGGTSVENGTEANDTFIQSPSDNCGIKQMSPIKSDI